MRMSDWSSDVCSSDLAAVIAIFITLIGAFAYPQLPLAQYPDIAPPTISISAAYPGASSETMAETVAATLEPEINGVENMLYIQRSSTQGQAPNIGRAARRERGWKYGMNSGSDGS